MTRATSENAEIYLPFVKPHIAPMCLHLMRPDDDAGGVGSVPTVRPRHGGHCDLAIWEWSRFHPQSGSIAWSCVGPHRLCSDNRWLSGAGLG